MPLQYAILHHTGVSEPHFDLMFETYPGSALTTWRSPNWPISVPTPLTRLKDHRREYLTFEGEISKARGRVEQLAAGTCTVEIAESATWHINILTGTSPCLMVIQDCGDGNWEGRPM